MSEHEALPSTSPEASSSSVHSAPVAITVATTDDGFAALKPQSEVALHSTTVMAQASDKLSEAIDRAVVALEVETGHDYHVLTSAGYWLTPLASVGSAAGDDSARDWFPYEAYGVTSSGELLIAGKDLDHLTVADFRRAASCGYVPGNWDQLVIVAPELGGGPEAAHELVAFINELGIGLASAFIMSTLARLWRQIGSWRVDRRARTLAAAWNTQGIRMPRDLIGWVDCKTGWTLSEVSMRLHLDDKGSERLLKACGFEYHSGVGQWVPGTRKKAQRRRKRIEKYR